MSTIDDLMDAYQTHLITGGNVATTILVHDQKTWDNLTNSNALDIGGNPKNGSWTYKKIPLLLSIDPKKTDDFTFMT